MRQFRIFSSRRSIDSDIDLTIQIHNQLPCIIADKLGMDSRIKKLHPKGPPNVETNKQEDNQGKWMRIFPYYGD